MWRFVCFEFYAILSNKELCRMMVFLLNVDFIL